MVAAAYPRADPQLDQAARRPDPRPHSTFSADVRWRGAYIHAATRGAQSRPRNNARDDLQGMISMDRDEQNGSGFEGGSASSTYCRQPLLVCETHGCRKRPALAELKSGGGRPASVAAPAVASPLPD